MSGIGRMAKKAGAFTIQTIPPVLPIQPEIRMNNSQRLGLLVLLIAFAVYVFVRVW